MNKKCVRFTALLACLALVCFMISSVFYIAKEADHHCTGHDCEICASIQQVEETAKGVENIIITPVIEIVVMISAFVLLVEVPDTCETKQTLISQRIRLNI